MSKQITLTDDERRRVISRLWGERDLANIASTVDRVVEAINAARREGDPLGTVRRNPKTGEIAVRALFHCSLIDCKDREPYPSWHWIDEEGVQRHARTDDSMSAKDIEGWPVIYWPTLRGSMVSK